MFRLDVLLIESRYFPPRSRNAYLLAATLVTAAVALRMTLGAAVAGAQFITLFPAVFASTLICGIEAGFLAVALGAVAAEYFLLPPLFSFRIERAEIPALAFFVVVGTMDVVFIGAMRAAIDRARHMNETLTTAFEANPLAILLIDARGRILNVNEKATILFAKPRSAMVGAALETLIPERFRDDHVRRRDNYQAAPRQRAMASGREVFGLRDDGTEFPIDVQIGPIQLADAPITIAIVRDLTEQNAMLAALAESQRREATLETRARMAEELRLWADAFKCAAIGIEISDPVSGIVRVVNPAYAAERGMTVEEASGRNIAEACAAEERPRLPALLTIADRDGRVTVESIELRKDGSRFPALKDIVSVRDADGTPLYRVASSRDISESKRVEAAARHAQKMEAIGRIAAGVSHDFNNLLQSIMGGLELVLDDLPVATRAHEFAEVALKSAARGATLARHLLAYARKQALFPQAIDLPAFFADITILMTRSLGPHLVVEARVEAGTAPVFADPDQLRTALLNLVLNAAHAMPGGGTLSVAASAGRDDDADRVVIRVADTGTGMDEATLANATDPFFSTKGLEGTGLGLSMVEGFAEQSGGALRISSCPDAGTIVDLCLPAAPAPAAAPVPAPMPLGWGRILLVDDAADILTTTGAFLTKAGFDVVGANGGGAALSTLADGARFDAIATDYAMPAMNGVELILRSRMLQPGLPALIMTGLAEVSVGSGLPADVQVLRKPLSRLELIQALQRLTRRNAAAA